MEFGKRFQLRLRWNELRFEGIFKGLPCSVVGRLGCNGSGHSIASPFSSGGVLFKVGQSRHYFLVISIERIFVHHEVILEDVPKG